MITVLKKIIIQLCLMLVCGYSTAQISLGGLGYNRFINDTNIDTISGLSGIPEGYTAVGFSISATVKGFEQRIESRSAKLNAAQRQLMYSVKPGEKIYIGDIKIKNNRTQKISSEPVVTLVKDGVTANMPYYYTMSDNIYTPQRRRIYAYPSSSSSDTSQFIVQSFEIEAVHPDFIYHASVMGNEIDSATFAQITKIGYGFTIKNIVAEDIKTGNREDVRAFTINDDGSGKYLCRSKNYFMKKNCKINFVYPMPAVIDSVSGVFVNGNAPTTVKFAGGTFTKEVQKLMKRTPLYSVATFSVYYNGKEEKINVMIVD